MTQDDIIRMAREAGATTVDQDDPQCWIGETAFDDDGLKRFFSLVAAAEREACIAKIQAEIDHAHINELRLTPPFGRRQGEIAVRASDLDAALEAIQARGQQQ